MLSAMQANPVERVILHFSEGRSEWNHHNIGGDSFLFWPVKRGIHMLGRYIRYVFFSLCLLSVSSLAQSPDSVRHDSYSETDKFVSCAQVTLARHVLY